MSLPSGLKAPTLQREGKRPSSIVCSTLSCAMSQTSNLRFPGDRPDSPAKISFLPSGENMYEPYPALSFTSLYQGLGNADNNGTDPQFFQNWTGVDDVSWVKGAHQLKFGFEGRIRKMTILDRRNEGGTFNFSPLLATTRLYTGSCFDSRRSFK